jgi:hypothetical protein
MAFDLKRFLKGVVAQINPWDDGATYKSVTAPKPASTARPTANQTSINKTYQAKLPEAIRREESQVDWLGKLLTDRDWKKRAERNAMSQAINQEMNKTQDYQAPVIRNNLNALRGQNLTAFRNSQKAIDNSNLIRDYGQEWKKTAGSFVKDYANPLGKYGIFGEKSIAENTKNIQDAGDMYRSGVDKVLQDEANNKFDSWKDVARLAWNLPVGMVQGVGEAPKDYRELFTGKRLNLDEKGHYIEDGNTDLTTAQRAGAGANAFINTAGLAFGGSGTLLKGAFGKQIIKELGKTGFKNVFIQVLKKFGTDAAKEYAEEFIQSFATDLQTAGKLDPGSLSRANQAGWMGAAGSVLMTGGGKVISKVKTGINNKVTTGLVSNKTEVKPVVDPIVKQDTVKPITKQSSFNPSIEELNYTRAQRLAEVNKLLESGASENSRPVIDRLKAIRDIDETIKRETQQAKEADKRKKQSGSVPAGMFDPFNITDKLTKQEVPAIQPKVNETNSLLTKKAKNYNDANRFEKKYNPIEGSEIWERTTTSPFSNDDSGVRVNMFPDDIVKGKGITKSYMLNLFKEADNKGIKRIIPSMASYTKDGAGFMDKLAQDGWINKVRDGVYEISPKIKEWDIKRPLLDIYNQAHSSQPTKVTQLPPERVKAILKKEKQAGFATIPGDKTKVSVKEVPAITPEAGNTPVNEMGIDVARRLNLPELGIYQKVTNEVNRNGGRYDVAAERLGLKKEWDKAVRNVSHAKLMDDQKNNPGMGILGNGDNSTPQPKPEVPAVTPTKPVTPELPIIGQRLQNQTKAKTQSKQSQAKSPKVPANQGKQLSKQDTVLPVEVKSQINSLVASSKLSPNSLNDALNTPLSQILGDIKAEADPALPTFNAVAAGSKSKSTKKLTNFINQDAKITKAAIEAQNTGKEINFFAKKDANDRGVGIERFNPKTHKIEAGFVVDQDGNILGNHIKVDDTGIQVNVGGDLVNMEQVIGNPNDWKGKYRLTDTPSRVIDSNAPNKQIAQTAKDYLVGSKVKAEANFRTELEIQYKDLGKRIKTVESARPKNISKDVFKDDIFSVLNGDKTDTNIRSTYDAKTAKVILDYKKQTRALYDSLLVRINKERVKFGQSPIDARKDYITHLQEMNGSKSFVGEVIEGARNSFTDEGTQTTRGSVPGQIAGRTENFKPISAYNKFLQRRKGTKSLRDPFLAVQEYLEPALYNIHMTEPTARARAVEAAFRTAGELRDMTPDQMLKQTEKILEPYKNSGDNSKLVAGFQEYANTLAKKTNRIDRVVIDSSQAGATGMKAWTGLQRAGGQATILGNVSSALAQPLNQVVGIADAGPINYMKGVARSLGDDNAINQSNFIKARRAKADKPIRNTGKKILDAGAIPLEVVETASIEVIWNSQHAKAQSKGYKGAEAIKQADYNTERLVAGRGIGDRPEAYRSRLSNGLLQYTLEVNAQNKVFWKDLNTKQKATFLVAAMGTNALMGAITGFEPLPDFLKAAIDTGSDLLDDEDDRGVGEKLLEGGQRILGEYASMNPVISASANAFMPQDMRKAIFGSESDLGRFEGTAAPVQVIKNVYKAGDNAIKGNWTEARNDILRTIPFGNQARKSITGAEANARGYAVDKSGKPTYATSDSIIDKVKNFLFGPTADPKAREYYDNNRRPLTDLQAETLKTLEKNEQLDFLKSITEERAENKQNDKEIERLNKGSESETKTLKSGKVAYKNADGEWKIAKDQKSADIALKKSQAKKLLDEFEDSDKNYEVKDGLVYRRKEDGTAYTTPQNKFESQVRKQQLQSLKATDDVAGWLITAEAEAKDLIRQLNDPNVDPLDRLTIENDIRSLIENIAKYKNYGGFTKPKKAKEAKEPKEYKGTPRTPIASRTFSELYGDSYDTSSALRKLLQNVSTIKRKVIK